MPFDSSKGPLQITKWHSITIVNLHAINGWFIFHQYTQIAIARTSNAKKKKKKNQSVNSHINTYLCQFMAQHSKIRGVKKIVEIFDISKIGTFWPSKQPIDDLFKDPNQDVYKTIGHTYGQILDQISESWVSFKLSWMCSKTSSVSHPPKMVWSYSLGTCLP